MTEALLPRTGFHRADWPPPIPACRADDVENQPVSTLIWVHSGTARITVPHETHAVEAGEALWIPPGVTHSVRSGPESVVLPLHVPLDGSPAPLDRVLRLTVPPGWDDWLVHRFACVLGYGYGGESTRGSLLDWIGPEATRGPGRAGPARPPLPHSAPARAVAQRLIDGEFDVPLARLAAEVKVSERTLQRRFLAETGLSFARWRRAARVDLAARHIAAGRSVTWASHQVGYATPSGLAHAFAAVAGRNPASYSTPPRDPDQDRELVRVLTGWGRAQTPPTPPEIPEVPEFASVDDFDIAVWAYRGPVHLRIGGRRARLETGDAVWLPAGIPDTIRTEPGAILLPLGARPGFRARSPEGLRVLSMPEEYAAFLLHSVVANHTDLRPPGHDDQHMMDALWAAHRLPETLDDLPPAVAHVMTALADDPSDRRSLADFAAELGVDNRVLSRQFREATSQPFTRWRAQLRMTIARNLLWQGLTPSTVARRLGYRHLSGFSRLFTEANHMTPRQFIRTQVESY